MAKNLSLLEEITNITDENAIEEFFRNNKSVQKNISSKK